MWFESEEGNGSIFHFNVILKKVPKDDLLSMSPMNPGFLNIDIDKEPLLQAKCKGKQILIIEPCATLLRVLSSWLSILGFKPVGGSNSQQALSLLSNCESNQCPLVIMSNAEPKEYVNLIKSKRPVIVMGYETVDGTESLPFLKKPVRLSALRQHLVKFFLNYKEESSPSSQRLNTPSLKILIAEDNVMNQRVIRKILQSIGKYKNDFSFV